MNTTRLTFNSSTNLTIPMGIFDILYLDAYYYGYVKNEKPNISGFINYLIPSLSEYQDDLHERLLKYNHGDAEITKIAEQSIHNVYLSPYNFHDDAKVNVPFRINREYYDEFILIHDVKLAHYNTDFTGFVRNLLVEYATKTIDQREYLYAYRMVKEIHTAIEKSCLCHFYSEGEKISFVPVAIEVSPVTRHNLVVGCTMESMEPKIIELAKVQTAILDTKTLRISEADCNRINEETTLYYQKESTQCLE